MVQIYYNEAMTMLYLSQLVYDYHTNDQFHLLPNETLSEFIKRININDSNFDYIRKPLFYLLKNIPNAKLLEFISDDETDTQVGIVVDDINKNIVIAFRGTESIKDCYYDINFYEQKIKNFKVHAGFYKQVKSVKKQILTLIESYFNNNNNNYNLYLTGHSLGSANATLLSYFISEKYPNLLIKLVTFGSPRVGNAKWKDYFDNNSNIVYYRVTNNRDIVTVIPSINYCHVGKHIYLNDDDIFHIENSLCSSLLYRSIFHSFSVCDHKILNYVKNMKNKQNEWTNLNNDLEDVYFVDSESDDSEELDDSSLE